MGYGRRWRKGERWREIKRVMYMTCMHMEKVELNSPNFALILILII